MATYDIPEILDRLPTLTDLFRRDGHDPRKSGSAWFVVCPFHQEKSPSCQVNDDRRKFHCYGCGASGDAIDYWQKSRGISFQDAIAELASIAGIGPQTAATQVAPRTPKAPAKAPELPPLTGDDLSRWQLSCKALADSPEEIQRIADWRGIDPECIAFAARAGLMGSYSYYGQPREAFLVERADGAHGITPVSVHIRLAPHTRGNERSGKASFRYHPAGCGAWPFLLGDPATADHIFIVEGQWDALALTSIMGWHRSFPKNIAVFGLRGSTSGTKLLQHNLNPQAYIFAFADADGAGERWFETGGLLDTLATRLKKPHRLYAFWPGKSGADLNDLVKSGDLTRDDVLSLILPKLPNSHTRVSGPTFTQWCRAHTGDPPPIGPAVAYVLADPLRLTGRRPLAAWQRHWQRIATPPDTQADLLAAWKAYRLECT